MNILNKKKSLTIVIPVYNEEENISPLYNELKEVLSPIEDYEIIFIDDGSTDGTYKELTKIHKFGDIKIIKFRRNFGQTAALKAGFDFALGDILITMDADMQNDPKDIINIMKEMEDSKYDAISGWRYERRDKITKKIYSRLSNWLARKLTGLKIHDFGCTLKAYKKECIKDLELYGEIHRYIPALLSWRGYKIKEIKVNHRKRKYGKTKYNFWRLFKGLLDIINIKFWIKYSTRPLHFFGIIGIFSFFSSHRS